MQPIRVVSRYIIVIASINFKHIIMIIIHIEHLYSVPARKLLLTPSSPAKLKPFPREKRTFGIRSWERGKAQEEGHSRSRSAPQRNHGSDIWFSSFATTTLATTTIL